MYGLLTCLSFRRAASHSPCKPTLGRVHRKALGRTFPSRCQADISRIDVFADLSTVDLGACDRWSLDAVADTEKSRVVNRKSGMCINSNFDSGNINVVSADPGDIQLQIRADPYCETDGRSHFQWFYFRVTGAKDTPLTMNIVNAGDASFPEGWEGYDACCSVDRINWFRVPSTYDKEKGVFSFSHTPSQGAVFYAYFAPYPYERHLQLISEMQMSEDVTHETLGETLDGHDLDLLIVGDEAPHKKKVWIIARQHPGETMAEWFIEGLLQRVTDRHDGVARDLLTSQATLYVVPNMNPDGSWRGHLRTDGNGINMNRTWATATEAEVPSVYHVLRKMRETGVDLFVDVHGDEALPHNFIACAEGVPSWSKQMELLKEEFSQTLRRAHPAFQTEHGYEIDAPNCANMGIATNFVAEEFKCFTMTLEMPFKDCADLPDKEYGWSPQRCMRFGAAFLSAVRQILPRL